jgi:cytochrome oxidase assembly protein ShyY1
MYKIEMDSSPGPIIAMVLVSITFVTLFGLAFYQMSTMTGSKDDWADVKKQVGLQYVDTVRVAYAYIFISVFAACMSFGALATAAITR